MIKTLIFDLGDVFINLDKTAIPRHLQKWGYDCFPEEMTRLNLLLETGKMSGEEFLDYLQKEVPHATRMELLESWNSVLKDFPQRRFEFLKEIAASRRFQLILLSNTDEIHMKRIAETVPFFEEFKNCFDRIYLSYQIHLRKPDKEIFELVIRQNNLNPQETLFTDDLQANTDAASELGFHVWNLQVGKEDVTQLFSVKKELFNS